MAVTLSLCGERHEIEIVRRRPHLVLRIDGRLVEVLSPGEGGSGRQSLDIDGRTESFVRAQLGESVFVRRHGRSFEVLLPDPRDAIDTGGSLRDEIHAPMPGAVVSVHRQAGDAVAHGETVVTIESMKLQTALVAPRDGVVAEVLKREGETFDKDALIVRLAEAVAKG